MLVKCLCESVQFTIDKADFNVYQCHCSLCRKQSGTASNLATFVKRADFHWVQGQELIKKWQKPSGFSSHFCGVCGTTLPNQIKLGQEDVMWLPIGLLPDGITIQKVAHFHVLSKACWDEITDEVLQYDTFPNNAGEMIKTLTA